MRKWSIKQALEIYNIRFWGGDYFDINEQGNLLVCPGRDQSHAGIDLYALTAEIEQAGLSLPVLVRFGDILQDRVNSLRDAFQQAMQAENFEGGFTAVYPIKVNQQRMVVESILTAGGNGIGLEAGSKSELMVVLAASKTGATVICNGYKDREYIRLALIGSRMGQQVYIVIEKLSELELVFEESDSLGITPLLGVRVRLASISAGKWQNSGGEKSKFGLSATQVLQMVECLREARMLHTMQLLHFHPGSQIPNIHDIQHGVDEGARYFSELHRLGAPISVVDVGGGLGVDYEGSRTRSFCSMNYTVQEYANNIVHSLRQICSEQNLPHPHIITESGRALTAHHAVFITNVAAVEQIPDYSNIPLSSLPQPGVITVLASNLDSLLDGSKHERSVLEAYHDAQHGLSEAQSMYIHGLLTLEQRALAEKLYFSICWQIYSRLSTGLRAHRDLIDELNEKLADKYFCNFSLFQSLPDVWAIDQLFPVVPLHRLNEEPLRRGVLQDITCDSDGRVDGYIEKNGVESTLPLHALRFGESYLLGIFLVGAYQEILGDRHNLFGSTNTVNVKLMDDGGYRLVDAVQGDSVDSVLQSVDFDPRQILDSYRSKLVDIDSQERTQYLYELEQGLCGYTYLDSAVKQ